MNRVNLHDVLAKHTFEHAVFCTYVFDAKFFEGYCLDRFASLRENNNITILLDRSTYDELISGAPAQWPRLANVRYLVHPIQAASTFHPKIFLLVSRSRGLLVIGSANLTKQGITSNAELVGVYHFEEKKNEQHRGLFRQAVRFLRALAERWPGADLSSNLEDMLTQTPWLSSEEDAETPARLLDNLVHPLWNQICEGISGPVDAVHVLSRYFDATPHQIGRIVSTLNPRQIVFWTQNEITTMTQAWLHHPLVKDRVASVRLCSYEDDGRRQPLHAKAIAIVRGKMMRLAYGSANFTTPGMFSAASKGNVETMLCLDEIPPSAMTPAQLFDPSGRSKLLENARLLQTAAREERLFGEAALIKLQSASVEDGRLVCLCEATEEAACMVQAAVLAIHDSGQVRVSLKRRPEGTWIGYLGEDVLSKCNDLATIVHIEGRPDERLSNRVLLVNLQDIVSNRSQRRERRIREAQQSAAHFARVLDELLAASDTEGLIRFLTYCDIHMIDVARPLPFARPRPPWTGDDEMRRIGERNLREYASLHEAALGFCQRHIRRLHRHCERPSSQGAPNFMHIAVAVGNVLRAQVERALIGFEHMRTPLTNIEWGDHRDQLERYLDLFKQVMHIVCSEYIPELPRLHSNGIVQGVIRSDIAPLVELWQGFRKVRARVTACIENGLSVLTPRGKLVPPLIRDDNLIAPQRWYAWGAEIQVALDATTRMIGKNPQHMDILT